MRKSIAIGVWLVFLSFSIFGGDKWFVSAGAGAVFSGDERFKDLYGGVQFSPELKAGYVFYDNFYLWLGYSFFSATYTIPVLLDEAEVNQHFLALGVGWEIRRGRLQSDFFAALVWAGFREQALGESFTASSPGFQLGTGLRYFLEKRIFVGVAFSYCEARVTLAETAISLAGRRFLGGLRLAANLGLRF
jgi:opacity protein-like surface antigen